MVKRILKRLGDEIKSAFKVNIVAGILVLVPLVATIFFLKLFVTWVDRIWHVFPEAWRPEEVLPFPVPGLGLVFLLMVLFLSGFFVRNLVGRKLLEFWEWFLSKIPFVNWIYIAVKQLLETITITSSKEFKRVVLLEYPRRGVYALAYVTGTATGEVQQKTDKKCINLFLPSTPNPTTGFYLIVPEDDVIPLDMSVEESFKLLMSGGILSPEKVRQSKMNGALKMPGLKKSREETP